MRAALIYIAFLIPWIAAIVIGIPGDVVVEPVVDVPYEPVDVVLKGIMINNVSCTFTSPGSDHKPVRLIDNSYSVDVSYDKVLNFVKYDKTDELRYNDSFMCAEFATQVHNRAERLGIKAHVVVVKYNNEGPSHMINGFNTTDKGMIFFDCTGTTLGNTHLDKEVKLTAGMESNERSVYSGLKVPGRPVKIFYVV